MYVDSNYFRCTRSEDMYYPLLEEQVSYFKETQGGRRIMCKAFEELAEERVLEEKKEMAKRMLVAGKFSVEEIAIYAGLSVDVVKELEKSDITTIA